MRSFSKEELKNIIGDYQENHMQTAPEDVRKARDNFYKATDDYLSSISDDSFRQGFLYAFKLIEEGVM